MLLIEYSLNDSSGYGESRSAFENWARFYEAIIRHALTENPRLKILSVMFATRTGAHRRSISMVPAGISFLTDWYGVSKIDVNQEFVKRFGANFHDIPGAYADSAHYTRPFFTRLAAECIADSIIHLAATPERVSTLPPAVDPLNPSSASVSMCRDWTGFPSFTVQNSRFEATGINLAGASVELKIRGGQLLGVLFACVPAISRLFVTSESVTYECPTLRAGVRDGKFKFLIATVNFEAMPPPYKQFRILKLQFFFNC